MDISRRRFVILILIDDVLTNPNALVTDKDSRTSYELTNVILAFVAGGLVLEARVGF